MKIKTPTNIIPSDTLSSPYNLQAEQMLLGAILVNNEMLDRVSEFLKADHFYEPIHRKIYEAINLVIEKGISATPVSLSNMFGQDEQFKSIGGTDYLGKLAMMATTVINAGDYGKITYDLAVKRQLIGVGEEIVNIASNSGINHSAAEQIEAIESKLFNLSAEGLAEKGFVSIEEIRQNTFEHIHKAKQSSDKIHGITTGFIDLDEILGGFNDSDLVILAARPSMGKTALLLNFAFSASIAMKEKYKNELNNIPTVGIFSLEMTSEQLFMRMLSMHSEIEFSKIKTGKFNEENYNLLREKGITISGIHIDDTPALTIAAIRTRARRLKRKHNLAILFIDYLQLIRGSNNKSDNRVIEVAEITQGLKALAKELNIPIIAAAQLSRAVEQREDKKPMLSDLRESGSIEQDADIVMFLYREEYYLTRKEPTSTSLEAHREWLEAIDKARNRGDVIIAKHRNGPVGSVPLFFDSHHSLFKNYKN